MKQTEQKNSWNSLQSIFFCHLAACAVIGTLIGVHVNGRLNKPCGACQQSKSTKVPEPPKPSPPSVEVTLIGAPGGKPGIWHKMTVDDELFYRKEWIEGDLVYRWFDSQGVVLRRTRYKKLEAFFLIGSLQG